MSRFALTLPFVFALTAAASAQGFTPEEAVKRMKLPDGFSARCVASEPMIRQPVSMSFDNRGRLWVMQYLQYPAYAGLKVVKQDQYLRTVWDKVPEPPPHGPKGDDKLTILYDPDEHGVFRKSKDFVTGLNIASGFCLGNGGVYVAQPPYLLFYPDKNEDDIPDGDPEVLLSGFGMEDTHALANSLQFGPDGWLYGATGSTCTNKIKNPADAKAPAIEFQQGIWRYHPKTKRFELFSEGGGNTWGLDFDKNGQAIAGTNWGGFAMLHQMQGAYYVKGFSKHGPLHNPHAYGYFEHVPYTGFKGGHVTCGGIIYQADTYPKEYRDQYIAANLLSNAIYWHKLEAVKSSFKASHGGELLEANDTWFRPVDLIQGPDGCVYVADFYDKRANHVDPVDNWDKTNGRIYRIEYNGGPKFETFDLRKKTTPELLELLKHSNVWWRREARQLLADRQDKSAHMTLRKWVKEEKGQLALEALWTLYCSGGWTNTDLPNLLRHPSEYVRAWAIRLSVDHPNPTENDWSAWCRWGYCGNENSPIVLAQLACSARRIGPWFAEGIAEDLVWNELCETDPNLSLLTWWALETAVSRQLDAGEELSLRHSPGSKPPPLVKLIMGERLTRRLMAVNTERVQQWVAWRLEMWAEADPTPFLQGMLKAVAERKFDAVPEPLRKPLADLRKARPTDELLLEILARMGDADAVRVFMERIADKNLPDLVRVNAVDLVKQVRPARTEVLLFTQLAVAKSDAMRTGLLGGLESFDDPKIGETVLAAYSSYSPAVKKRAIQLLLARPAWALQLLKEFDAGKFPKAELTPDHARAAVALGDKDVTALVEKHFGKIAPATAGEKVARITALNASLGRNKSSDAARGKVLFTKHCAACHQLHGEGGKVGPDLTTADRKNRGYMLAQIVDPSGYIRPEFVVQNVLTTDERKLSGIVTEMGESIALVNVVNDQPVTTLIAKKDIADIRPSAISLMPEKLLDTFGDEQVADLFAYMASDSVLPAGASQPKDKPATKLKLALVSGSFEYKSDESLAELQKNLEANYPVECVRIFAKEEKDTTLAGVERLEKCDVAIFFTRRLQIEGVALEAIKKFVKSGKPVIGIRTASHGFQNWLEMDKEVFGGNYSNHYGGKEVCEVSIAEKGKDHPILKGVSPFKTNGSLYKNPNLAADVTVVLMGSIPDHTEPVAWVREKDGRRVFYTSLGHRDDFKDANYMRLLVNALAWVTKTELKK